MSLKPSCQLFSLDLNYQTINTSERGGILSYATVSGIVIAQYSIQPSGAIPIGIQQNDVEHMDLSRQVDPRRHGQRVDQPYGLVGIITGGDVITDWLYIVGNLIPGQIAYVGPSGTITNDPSFGSRRIGIFLSQLESDPHTVIFAGAGWSREVMDFMTKRIYIENDPANAILVPTPGYAKLRISRTYMQ